MLIIWRHVKTGRVINIDKLYAKLYPGEDRTPVRRQQIIGASISRLNAKVMPRGYVIRPGNEKRSYQLARMTAAPARSRRR